MYESCCLALHIQVCVMFLVAASLALALFKVGVVLGSLSFSMWLVSVLFMFPVFHGKARPICHLRVALNPRCESGLAFSG